jgi:hypothetical protein
MLTIRSCSDSALLIHILLETAIKIPRMNSFDRKDHLSYVLKWYENSSILDRKTEVCSILLRFRPCIAIPCFSGPKVAMMADCPARQADNEAQLKSNNYPFFFQFGNGWREDSRKAVMRKPFDLIFERIKTKAWRGFANEFQTFTLLHPGDLMFGDGTLLFRNHSCFIASKDGESSD